MLFDIAAANLGDIRGRLLLADLFVADVDDDTAAELCQAALRFDANNLAVLIRLADIRQRQASLSGHTADAIAQAETILRQSPNNVRALLALARNWSTAQKFKTSAATYGRLIVADPDFLVARLERARVLYSDHAFNASSSAYGDLHPLPITEQMRVEVASGTNGVPYLDTFTGPRVAFDILHGEITQPTMAPLDADARGALQRNYYDAVASTADARYFELENRAKSLKGIRNYASIPAYKQLLEAEPANTEGEFDLGQVYSGLRQTNKAISTYAELLAIEPRHREAAIALERASAELQPQWLLNQDYFGQRGRSGLAAIDRYRYATAARIPFGDENEFAQFGFARVFYDPVNGQGVAGNILNFRVQEKPINKLLLYGQANLELYEPGAFKNRVTYDIGGIFEPIDLVRMYFNGFQQNVVESAGSLRQDIHRGGIRFGGDIRPTRRWDFGGNYLYADYSDHNSLAEFHLFNEVLLMYLPTQLKLVTQMDYDSFAHASVLNPLDPTNSTFAVHPYFSPRGFSFYENRLEWTHYVSRDYFAHANVCYYSLQYGLGFDNNFKTYHRFRALFNYDICSWASIGMDSNVTLSPLYEAVGASAYVVLRWPHFRQ